MSFRKRNDRGGCVIKKKSVENHINCINKENIDSNNNIIKNKRRLSIDELVATKRPMLSDMLNGYRTDQRSASGGGGGGGGNSGGDHVHDSPVATLSNMGNTCWLNSVLYTLRFAPTFLHNLHHLIGDLQLVNTRLNQNKIKTSSLGRNNSTIGTSASTSSRSRSSKDLLSLQTINLNENFINKSKYQIVTEKLHELYCIMHQYELKDTQEPYQPDALLQAIRDANSIFDGNHQQDAHELLVYLLDNLRETCDLLQQQVTHQPDLLNDHIEPTTTTTTITTINSKLLSVSRSLKKVQKKKEKKDVICEEQHNGNPPTTATTEIDDTCSIDSGGNDGGKKRVVDNFIVEDFQGITLRRTRCLECESITERKEPFYDIPVAIPIQDDCDLDLLKNTSEIFRRACVLSEKLCDTNKYLCEQCSHYNEAVRDVLFERLPNIMVLQLKRFTTTTTGIQKVNTYLPTPLQLECFCETCCKCTLNNQLPPHHYQLCCVIMHLGGTMASGHYISYIKASDHLNDYIDCTKNLPKSLSLSSSSSEKSLNFLKYFKPKQIDNNTRFINKTLTNGVRLCKSLDCCGIKLNRNILENTINKTATTAAAATNRKIDVWLECDDENIRPITVRQFQDELSYKPNSTSTPYLLFYSKITETTID